VATIAGLVASSWGPVASSSDDAGAADAVGQPTDEAGRRRLDAPRVERDPYQARET
jgi:hypothetical protein